MNREIIENALTNIEDKLITDAVSYKKKKRFFTASSVGEALVKAAIVVITVVCLGTATAYAAARIYQLIVTKHAVSVGDPKIIMEAEAAPPPPPPVVEVIEEEAGTDQTPWIEKRVEVVNGYATNTYYTFERYEDAIGFFEMKSWLDDEPGTVGCVTAVSTETDTSYTRDVDIIYFRENGGEIFMSQHITESDMDYGASYGVGGLENTGNVREYVSAKNNVFTLVDEVREDTITYVILIDGEYRGYISFRGMTEKEIQEVLDMIVMLEEIRG